MAQRLLRTSVLTALAIALLLGGGSAGTDFANAEPRVSISAWLGSHPSQASAQPELLEKIAFSSTRDNPRSIPSSLPRST